MEKDWIIVLCHEVLAGPLLAYGRGESGACSRSLSGCGAVVSQAQRGPLLGACSCSSGGSRFVVAPQPPYTTAAGPKPRSRNRRLPDTPGAGSQAPQPKPPAAEHNKSGLPTCRAPSNYRTCLNIAAQYYHPVPSPSPRSWPPLTVSWVCQGTLSSLDKPKKPLNHNTGSG